MTRSVRSDARLATSIAGLSRRVRRHWLVVAVAAGTAIAALPALAQDNWTPTRPIRLIVPFAPGGGADVVARIVAQALGNRMGQPVVVENKAGAGGAIGSEYVYSAAPDGYTIQMATVDSHSIHPQVYTKVRFKSPEFTAIAPVVKINFVLAGRADLPARTFPELLVSARKDKLSYGMWGVGSSGHVAMNMFTASAKLPPMLPVPYQGAGPALQALLGGQVDLMLVPTPLAVAQRGRITYFGLSSPQRNEALKEVPTLGEQGVPIDTDAWIGIVAPPRMPPQIANFIARHVAEVVAEPEVQKRLREQGMEPHLATRDQFAQYLALEYRRWGQTVKDANIQAE